MTYLFLVTGEVKTSMRFDIIFDTLKEAIEYGARILAEQQELREIGVWDEKHTLTKYDIHRTKKE